MKESIYTIPISAAFDSECGCPLCALHAKLEEDSLQYVMGPAMMEPDVRIETNRQGFCARHLVRMMDMRNRLSLALILESLTDRLAAEGAAGLATLRGGCYVCRRVENFMGHFFENTVLMWKTEPEFAVRLAARPDICLPHVAALLAAAGGALRRRDSSSFEKAVMSPLARRVALTHDHLSAFCKSFDHRSAGRALTEEETYAVERATALLTGEEPA